MEVLTEQLARKAWTLFQEVEKRGGMAKAVLAGYPQSLWPGRRRTSRR